LEHVLGEINADGANLHMDDPSGDSLFNDHPLAHSMPGAGVVHHITFDPAAWRLGRSCFPADP